MHTNDVTQIAVPPEDNAEHVVEFGERHVIGDRDQADDPRAHLPQNRSQNHYIHISKGLDLFLQWSRQVIIFGTHETAEANAIITLERSAKHIGIIAQTTDRIRRIG